MMKTPKEVSIRLRQGPVKIASLSGKAASNKVNLWEGITAEEEFPAADGSAFYWLTLTKSARKEVAAVENELQEALRALSHVWHFAGGSMLRVEKREADVIPEYESNAEEVEEALLEERGLKPVTASASASIEICARYQGMPLRRAAELARAARGDASLRRILRYYHSSYGGSPKWWADLYKIRDELKGALDDVAVHPRVALGISQSDWSKFGRVLNHYDLRHAPGRTGTSAKPTPQEIREVKKIGRRMVDAYISFAEV